VATQGSSKALRGRWGDKVLADKGASSMEGNSVLRWVRALTLASVMLAGGLTGHLAAGGVAPASSALLPVFVLLTAAIAPLLGEPASTPRVIALLAAGQGLLHVVLQLLGGTAIEIAGHSMLMPAGPGDAVTAHLLAHGSTTTTGGWMALLGGPHLGMLLAHAAAASVVGLWLAAGERAAWTVVAVAALPVVDAWIRLRELARADAVAWAVPRQVALPRWSHEVAVRPSTWAGRGVSRRGPPRLRAA
jgi:hypothetical protein